MCSSNLFTSAFLTLHFPAFPAPQRLSKTKGEDNRHFALFLTTSLLSCTAKTSDLCPPLSCCHGEGPTHNPRCSEESLNYRGQPTSTPKAPRALCEFLPDFNLPLADLYHCDAPLKFQHFSALSSRKSAQREERPTPTTPNARSLS